MNTVKLTVGYLGFHKQRLEAHKLAFHFIKKIKPENRDKVWFKLLYDRDDDHWTEIHNDLITNGFKVSMHKFNSHLPDGKPDDWNYIRKCRETVNTNTEFACKMDEDVFISNHSWDFILENIQDFFSSSDVLAASPIISNGIPTTELFIRNVLTKEEQDKLYELFYNYKIDDWWGVDYKTLAEIRNLSKTWDENIFFNLVEKIPHYYKGVHPIRFCRDAQILINEYALKHIDKIIQPQQFGNMFVHKPAYLCNTFYFIRTEVWKNIIYDKTLFRDGMDEVPLNLYRRRHNLNFGYLEHVNCVHLFYNSLQDHGVLEQEYVEKYKNAIL